MTSTENLKVKISNSISFKLGVILLLIVLIQVPLSYVRGLIYEREQMQQQAQNQISKRWGANQYIAAPLINIYSYNTNILNSNNSNTNTNKQKLQSIQAKTFNLNINLDAELRYLGIYEAAVFISDVKMSGLIEINQETREQYMPKLFIPIKHIRGLKALNKISINNQIIKSLPQQTTINNISGIEVDLSSIVLTDVLTYEIEYKLAGSGQFDIIPLARNTQVTMLSNWLSPSFVGDYLPDTREINNQGFSASWQINKFIQSLGNNTITNNFSIQSNFPAFGVKILIPANIYQVNERTVKYSFLIVLLTFSGFFLAELFFKLRFHPFQYLLIGVSLSVFYLLLLSLSEYIKFNWAFLLSASSIIFLIGGYCSVVLQQRKRGIYTGLLFALLYGFIFILVKAEDTSLLMGSIGIWIILAMIMYLTRKIDWYAINVDENQ